MEETGSDTNKSNHLGEYFSRARSELFSNVNEFILDQQMNYFKRIETQDKEQL